MPDGHERPPSKLVKHLPDDGPAAPPASTIETFGEIFSDGSMIDLIRNETDAVELVFWDGSNASVSSEVNKDGKKSSHRRSWTGTS